MAAATGVPCARCGDLPRATKHVAYCRECWNTYQNDYRRNRYRTETAYRDKVRAELRQRRYGISDEVYAEMLEVQDGGCAICAAPPARKQLSVDHDHDSGVIRGLLCTNCNAALGMLKEDPALFQAAVEYLGRH